METVDAAWILARISPAHGEQAKLAQAMGIKPDMLTKILHGQRRVQAHEIPKVLAYFKETLGGTAKGFEEGGDPFGGRDAMPGRSHIEAQITPVNDVKIGIRGHLVQIEGIVDRAGLARLRKKLDAVEQMLDD